MAAEEGPDQLASGPTVVDGAGHRGAPPRVNEEAPSLEVRVMKTADAGGSWLGYLWPFDPCVLALAACQANGCSLLRAFSLWSRLRALGS